MSPPARPRAGTPPARPRRARRAASAAAPPGRRSAARPATRSAGTAGRARRAHARPAGRGGAGRGGPPPPRGVGEAQGEAGTGLVRRPDGEVGAGEQLVHAEVLDERDDADTGGQLDDPDGRDHGLLHHRQAARREPVDVGVAALGEDGEGTAPHPGDHVLAPDGVLSRRPISATTAETTSRPAFSRAAPRPSSSTISSVAPPAASARVCRTVARKPARLGRPVIGSVYATLCNACSRA